MVAGSSRRQAPTGSVLTAASLPGGRFANARSASSWRPAGVAARVVTVHLRRQNRSRRNSQGMATARIGVAATASASTTASQPAVVSRLWPRGDVKGGLACGGDGVAERVAHHRDTLGVLARGRQVAGNPVRADFDLAAGLADYRDGVVHGEADEHP